METSRIELTFEQHEIWRVRRGERERAVDCPQCPDRSPMIGAEDLAGIARVSPRKIYRLIESGELHFVETDASQVLVCLNSYSRSRRVSSIDSRIAA